MMSLNKPIIIAPDEFDAHFQKHLERRNARMWEGEPIDPEELQFMQDGDIDKYIDSMLASGKHLSPAFGLRGCYPFSELDEIVQHTQRLWTRVLENTKPFMSVMDLDNPNFDLQEKFDRWSYGLGSISTPIVHPELAADFFKWVYGEHYDPERNFPMPIGSEGWVPKMDLDPDRLWVGTLGVIAQYLFDKDERFESQQALGLVDFSLSLIPHLQQKYIFDLDYHYDEMTNHFGRRMDKSEVQFSCRILLSKFFGYCESIDPSYVIVHNDPELEEKVKERLFGENALPEIKTLVEYLHANPDNFGPEEDD